MRYFFHLRDAAHSIRDEEGIELPNLDDACDEILRALEHLHIENADLAQAARGWTLEVTDASGTVLFSVLLDRRLDRGFGERGITAP
jgi:hypothetical protein